MSVMAIDPGPEQSAWMLFDAVGDPVQMAIQDNESVLHELECVYTSVPLAIEMVASYGMPVGADVFETVFWAGRFADRYPGPHVKIYRKDVKMALCGNTRAKDANIRQALIDRYGPGKDKAVGTKRQPGPLYGVRSHLWAALAVGVTWLDQQRVKAA